MRVGAKELLAGITGELPRADLDHLAIALRIQGATCSVRGEVEKAVKQRLEAAMQQQRLGIFPGAERVFYGNLSASAKEVFGIRARSRPAATRPPAPKQQQQQQRPAQMSRPMRIIVNRISVGSARSAPPVGVAVRQTVLGPEAFIKVDHATLADTKRMVFPFFLDFGSESSRVASWEFRRAAPKDYYGASLNDKRTVCTVRNKLQFGHPLKPHQRALLFWTIEHKEKKGAEVLSWPTGLSLSLDGTEVKCRGKRALPVDVTEILGAEASAVTVSLVFRDNWIISTQPASNLYICFCSFDKRYVLDGSGLPKKGADASSSSSSNGRKRDSGLEEQAQTVPLTDPLSLERIVVPAKSVHCKHLQCFDGAQFLEMQFSARDPKWRCPHCNAWFEPSELFVDEKTAEIIEATKETGDEAVVFSPDGTWVREAEHRKRRLEQIASETGKRQRLDDDYDDFVDLDALPPSTPECSDTEPDPI